MKDSKCNCEEYRLYHRAIGMCLITLILIIAALGIFLYHEYDQKKADESYEIYNANMTEGPGVDGVWFPEGYYCVWAAGRKIEDINDTDTHERCHALIHENPEHFCRNYCEEVCKKE